MAPLKPWVTFDMDNTLVNSPYWRLHFRPWLSAEAGRTGTNYLSLWRQFGERSEKLWRRHRWVDAFDWVAIARDLGLPKLPSPPEPPAQHVRALVPEGVEAALWSLKKLPLRLGIVTNGLWDFQQPFIKALGWNYLFDAVVTPDRAGTAKPDPTIMAGVSPGLVHVGDRISHDVLVAVRSRRHSILVAGHRETDHIDPLAPAALAPDWTLSHWRQLPDLVADLLPSSL